MFEMTDAERAQCDRDGYLVRESVFSPSEVDAMVTASEELVAGLVAGREGRRFTVGSYTFEADLLAGVMLKWEGDTDALHGIEPFAHLSLELARWGLDPRFTEPMRHLVGQDDIALFTEKLNLKRAFHGGPNPLHQDRPYWDEAPDPDHTATAIVYLDDTTADNGCLEVVPGSHKDGRHPTRQDSDPFGNLEMDPRANGHLERVPVIVPAGSVVLFGAYLAHATGPNRTAKDRRALLYSYQPAGLAHSLEALRRLAGTKG